RVPSPVRRLQSRSRTTQEGTMRLRFCLAIPIVLAGCGGSPAPTRDDAGVVAEADLAQPPENPPAILPGPSRGSPGALSPDSTPPGVVTRDVGGPTVLRLAYPAGAAPVAPKVAEIDLGAGSEPWQAVVSPDGKRAYVILRQAQRLVAIDGLDGATP